MSCYSQGEFWSADENTMLLPMHSTLPQGEIGEALQGRRGLIVFQTSGTTGEARLVCHSRAGLLASARAVNAHLEVCQDDVWLCALPLCHVGGIGVFARAYCSGSSVYEFDGKWGAEQFGAQCARANATLVSLVPTQVFDLLTAGCRCPQSLRAVLVGGGRLDSQVEAGARKLGWPLLRTYGLTEAGSQVATQRGEHLLVLPHLETAIGERGRLKLRGASIAQGYLWANTTGGWRFESCVDADGWFQSDDVVELDGRRLRFVGRASSRVKVLGELVDVEALESAFLRFLGASREVALVDVPDARSENAIVLACAADAGGDQMESLIQAYNASVAGFERIARRVVIGSIPRGELGKIRRRELRRRVIEAEK